jgi:hypothetical protein
MNAVVVKDDQEDNMNTYTERLKREIERVTLKGNADKETLRILSSIIYDMDLRLGQLETQAPKVEVAPAPAPVVEEEPVTKQTSTRKVASKTTDVSSKS